MDSFQGDSGGPLLDKNNAVIAINESILPKEWESSEEQYVMNKHVPVDYYRDFIDKTTTLN